MRVIVVALIGLVFAVGIASGVEGSAVKSWRTDVATTASHLWRDQAAGRAACNNGIKAGCLDAFDATIADASHLDFLATHAPWCQGAVARRLTAAHDVKTAFTSLRIMVVTGDWRGYNEVEATAITGLGGTNQAVADMRVGGCTP